MRIDIGGYAKLMPVIDGKLREGRDRRDPILYTEFVKS